MLSDFNTILSCVNAAITRAITAEQLNEAESKNHGNEELFYPFLNIELLRWIDLDNLIGIGSGKIDISNPEKADSLLIFKGGGKIAIELKGGPSKKSYLLAGSQQKQIEMKFTKDAKGLISKLENIYQGNLCFDSQLGDIIKLVNLLHEGIIIEGYAIGLLKYKDSSKNEKSKYKGKLLEMTKALFENIQGLSYSYDEWDNQGLNVFIAAIRLSKVLLF
jgi:hypothetical protein